MWEEISNVLLNKYNVLALESRTIPTGHDILSPCVYVLMLNTNNIDEFNQALSSWMEVDNIA